MTFLRRLWGDPSTAGERSAGWRRMPRGWFMLLVIVGGWLLVGLVVWIVALLLGS